MPTSLQSTRLVKVLQWRRRCLENYLIDEKIIYDLLSDGEISKHKIEKRGEVAGIFKEIAFEQLRELIADEVYRAMNYENFGLRPTEVAGKDYADVAAVLFGRLETIQLQTMALTSDVWRREFVAKCESEHVKRQAQWEGAWQIVCDGKRFFRDLHKRFGVKLSPLKLKKLIVERMEREKADTWVLVQQLLIDALRT